MTLTASQPEPSRWEHTLNGGTDHINGYDDGEAEREHRTTEPVQAPSGNLDYETAEHLIASNN
jgi:hypothetical protein